jgi:D-alanyl-D-alanine dipeptidase
MSISVPRFGYPRLGTATEEAARTAGVSIATQPTLPLLSEPPQSNVTDPVDDPMVRIDDVHPRIKVVPHYQLGGWKNAIGGCWLRSEVAARLGAAVDRLPDRFGLVVYDGWRPRALQEELYLTALADPQIPAGLIAEPSGDDNRPAPHESGGAVDLALTIDGVPIAPGTDFDDTTSVAVVAALENDPGPDREARRMLYWAMRDAGFVVYQSEWWHFEYGTLRWAAIVGQPPIYAATTPVTTYEKR